MADLQTALVAADLLLASTGASQPLITRDMVAAAMEGRVRPLVILDLAVPRDVEPAAAEVDRVTLKDMDDLREAVAPDGEQLREVDRVRDIIGEEVPKFASWQRTHALAPLLHALQGRAEPVRSAEPKPAAAVLADPARRAREAREPP